MADTIGSGTPEEEGGTRRDFLYLATAVLAAVGTASFLWPFLDSMNPAADTLALSSVEVDLAPVAVGQLAVTRIPFGSGSIHRPLLAHRFFAASIVVRVLSDSSAKAGRG